jgi:hypothetical protein
MAEEHIVILDQPAPAQAPSAVPNHAAQWGHAALLLGCFLILVFPLAAVGSGAGAVLGALVQSFSDGDLQEWVSLVRIAVFILIGAAALALMLGSLGLRSAWSRGQPAGMAAAGTSVALIALVLHILLLVIYNHLAEDMLRERSYWRSGSRSAPPRGWQGQ